MIGFATMKSLRLTALVLLISQSTVNCSSDASFAGKNAPNDPPSSAPATSTAPAPTVTPPPDQTSPPPDAIVQGSFTVWPEPRVPAEWQNYDIHIQVKLPSNTTTYDRLDLSGTLTGTDGFTQEINGTAFSSNWVLGWPVPGKQSFTFVSGSGVAELVMHIPGAKRGVNDTIQVRSNLLNESQSISVTFN